MLDRLLGARRKFLKPRAYLAGAFFKEEPPGAMPAVVCDGSLFRPFEVLRHIASKQEDGIVPLEPERIHHPDVNSGLLFLEDVIEFASFVGD